MVFTVCSETEEAFKSCDDEEEGDIGGNLRVHCRDVARLTLTGKSPSYISR